MAAAASSRLDLGRVRASRVLVRSWRAMLAGGLGLLFVHDAFGVGWGSGHFFDRWLYEGLEALAAAGCLARAAFVKNERAAWAAFGVALLMTTGGDVVYDFGYGGNPPFPSAADALYLAFYPACYLAIVLLVRGRISRFN